MEGADFIESSDIRSEGEQDRSQGADGDDIVTSMAIAIQRLSRHSKDARASFRAQVWLCLPGLRTGWMSVCGCVCLWLCLCLSGLKAGWMVE